MRKNEWWTPQSANATTSVPCPYEDKRLMHPFWLVTLAVMVAVLSAHGNAATMVAADVNVLCRLTVVACSTCRISPVLMPPPSGLRFRSLVLRRGLNSMSRRVCLLKPLSSSCTSVRERTRYVHLRDDRAVGFSAP